MSDEYMAEVVIGVAALTAAWALSRGDGENEPFVGTRPIPVNYPSEKKPLHYRNPNTYAQPANQTTDKYFNGTCPTTKKGSTFVSLTGEKLRDGQFTHNNCVPFFGARLKGASTTSDGGTSILDSMSGLGSQQNKKKEVAPLFAPQKDVHWSHGMPNVTDFMLSRQVPSSRMANVKPWAEEKVGPGLGRDSNPAVGCGYNSGVQDRDSWLPKTVSELRVLTNPKETFSLSGHEGPAQSKILEPATVGTQGKVNKNRPDSTYTVGPSRWFTTTGAEKGETQRAEIILQPQDRGICPANYFGAGQGETRATYVNSYVNDSHKTTLCGEQLGPASGGNQHPITEHNSYENSCNNRATTERRTALGPLRSAVDAMISPVMDVIRHTRKTNMIGNGRLLGNASMPVGGVRVDNTQNKARTTIKEQTAGLLGSSHMNLQATPGMSVDMSCDAPKLQNRRNTSASVVGIAGPASIAVQPAATCASARATNNRRMTAAYFTGGQVGQSRCTGAAKTVRLVDKGNYVTDTGDDYQHNESGTYGAMHFPGLKGPTVPATWANFSGMTKMRNHDRGSCEIGQRINPDMLTAFKSNPYTHSLSSC